MGTLALVVALTLLISAFCSLLEATLYSTRIATLEAAARTHGRQAAAHRFLRMKHNVAEPTSAILILNTIANTAGAAVAGMYAATTLGTGWVPLFSAALTLAILFLSEILPKTYGATHWRSIWALVVWPLAFLERLLSPLIRITQGFVRLFTPDGRPQVVTADEILAMIHVGAKAGELTAAELRMLDSIFQFDKLLCRQVMVPRNEVVWIEADSSLADWLAEARRSRHSRYPVCRGDLDEAVGFVAVRDLIGLNAEETVDLESLLRPVHRAPETKRIREVLVDMQRTRQHMALVVDEHGGSAGIITLENVLERLVGSIQDEFDAETPRIVPAPGGGYIVRGNTPLEEINHELHVELRAPNINTLSGYLTAEAGRFPVPGDTFDIPGLTAEVLEVEGTRASRVRLQRRPADGSGVSDEGEHRPN